MRSYSLLIFSALIFGTAIAMSGVPAQENPAQENTAPGTPQKSERAEFESQFPVTDVNKPAPSDPKRRAKWQAKGKKYRGVGLRLTEESETVSVNTEWDVGLSALPAAQSDLVVIGEVTDAQAYLSEAKDWVYSEFTIRVDEALKNESSVPLAQGSLLVTDREGGRVRFPNGHTTLQYVVGQGMPRPGRRYALFLTCDAQEQSTHILTAYELRGGHVFPIDPSVGAAYREADETSFLNELRTAIAKAR